MVFLRNCIPTRLGAVAALAVLLLALAPGPAGAATEPELVSVLLLGWCGFAGATDQPKAGDVSASLPTGFGIFAGWASLASNFQLSGSSVAEETHATTGGVVGVECQVLWGARTTVGLTFWAGNGVDDTFSRTLSYGAQLVHLRYHFPLARSRVMVGLAVGRYAVIFPHEGGAIPERISGSGWGYGVSLGWERYWTRHKNLFAALEAGRFDIGRTTINRERATELPLTGVYAEGGGETAQLVFGVRWR